MANVKFLIGEKDGEEYDIGVEYRPNADDIQYDSSSSGIPASEVQGAIDYLNTSGPTGSGETNTVSNVGTGEGVYKEKVGVDFRLKSLESGSNQVNISGSEDEVVFDVNEENIDHQNLSGSGTNTHEEVDSHIDDSSIHFESGSVPHEDLDGNNETLFHRVNETSFESVTYTGNKTTNWTVWNSASMDYKLREEQYTYSGNNIATFIEIQYHNSGSIKEQNTETYIFNGNKIVSVTREHSGSI